MLVVPYTINEGSVTAVLTLPTGATVTGNLFPSEIRFSLPVGVFGLGYITFTAQDDVDNQKVTVKNAAMVTGIPSPDTHLPLVALALNEELSGVVDLVDVHTAVVTEKNRGSVVDETLTLALSDATETGVVVKSVVPAASLVPPPPHGAVDDPTITSGLDEQRVLLVEEKTSVAFAQRDHLKTSALITIRGVIEVTEPIAAVLPPRVLTGAIVDETLTSGNDQWPLS